MDFYDLFEKLLKERNLKAADVSRATGISTTTMTQWKQRKYGPKQDKLEKLCAFFNVPMQYFLGGEEIVELEPESVKIKVLGTVPAGVPIEAVEDVIGEETISMKMAQTGEFFGLRIKGDSMEPEISSGSIVIVRQQEDVENGEVAIVLINGSDATCKRIEKHERGIMLVPTNRAYEPQFFSNEDIERIPVRIIGRVMEARRKF